MTRADARQRIQSWGETLRTVVYALLIALVVRTFFFQPFSIPSASMADTLLEGDYILVSKYAYGYSRHAFPFSPQIYSGRLFGAAPERGDVAVFKLPTDGATDYIKRVIGLPGDTVQMIAGVLHINGEAVARVPDGVFAVRDGVLESRIARFRETLPGGRSHAVLDERESPDDDTPVLTVPEGHYFVMGDNRDNSCDSRRQPDPDGAALPACDGVGFVPHENLVGRAEIIFFSTNGEAAFWQVWKWPWAIRWERLFTRVG